MAKGKYSKKLKRRSRGSFILSLLTCLLCAFGSFTLYDNLYSLAKADNNFPLSRVVIKGNLKYITQKEVADVIGTLAGRKNLVALDLAPIHNALVQMPWVYQASVSKKYPDMLEVVLVEHYPSARWKKTGIYDAQNKQVFYPDMHNLNLPLVTLSAPHDSLAEDLYEHASAFIQLSKGSPYNIEEVHLDAARGYRIRLEGDVWLILGRESTPNLPMIRLKRFLIAFKYTKLNLKDVAYVDLRYDNGFAVGERSDNTQYEHYNTDEENTSLDAPQAFVFN